MTDRNATKPDVQITTQEAEMYRALLVFAYRSGGLGASVMTVELQRLVENARQDKAYLLMLIQVLKMVLHDMNNAERLAQFREAMVDKLAMVIAAVSDPETEELILSRIDFRHVPTVPGLSAAQVNAVAPDESLVEWA